MEQRIFGIETEFGCAVNDRSVGSMEHIVEAVKDYTFYRKKLGIIDLHSRDYFESARAGGFLVNGGRLYIDAVGSHEEYATPECTDLRDLIAYDRAGQFMLQSVLNDLKLDDKVSFHNNSIDHFGGHTFGCHENYLVKIEDRFFLDSLSYLLPFLVTRQIFAGVGRVGGHRINHHDFRNNVMELSNHEEDYIWVSNIYGVEIDNSVDYQLSQRADHILRTVSSRVRFNRAIINPKWSSYYSYNDMHRLHILFGESNMSEYALMLKVGTTSLVLDLVEMNALGSEVKLRDPLESLRSVSRDATWKWPVKRSDGSTISAIDLQRLYLEKAQTYLKGKNDQTDWVLREWEDTLDCLETDPMILDDRLDWVAKRKLLLEYMEAEGVDWHDDIMQSLDLAYHNVNPETGLYYGLVEAGLMRRITDDASIEHAVCNPPTNTRAYGRGQIVKALIDQNPRHRYVIDWDVIALEPNRQLELRNPFKTYEKEAEKFAGKIG